VLCLLRAGPLHPYGMQRLIKEWGKESVVNIGQRANLYKTIKRLHEAGLITVQRTERDQQYPERTVYELTDEGHAVGQRWLAGMLASPRNEYPEFPAALSFAMLLGPAELAGILGERAAVLEDRLAELDAELKDLGGVLPRVTLLETEYQRAVMIAELDWLRAVIDDLRSGALSWTEEQLAALAEEMSGVVPPA
jgi:DNA-binding PadR family transcriptional regulator